VALPQSELALEEQALLAGDNECANADGGCALNALQLRSSRGVAAPRNDTGADADALQVDLPAGWTASNDFPETWEGWHGADADEEGEEESLSFEVPGRAGAKLKANFFGWGSCAQRPHAKDCYLYQACRGPAYCQIAGYMIVPGHQVTGMENINGHSAGSFDYLMSAAKDRCSGPSCVLITNPVGHRTQSQFHIHYRHYNEGGAAVKRDLERALCGTSDWTTFWKCGAAKARIYDNYPAVFTEVARAYGGRSLGNIGVSVWFTTACGGYKTMILATSYCSIEHSISAR